MSKKNNIPVCGLCGKKKKLIKTDCCNNWICDDEDNYVIFSYARNSCSRNHRRFTLCGYHKIEDHSDNWQSCENCPITEKERKDIIYQYKGEVKNKQLN